MTNHYKVRSPVSKEYGRFLGRILVPFGWWPRARVYNNLRLPVNVVVHQVRHAVRFHPDVFK
ncbi:hypothetical protein LCGC14_1496220 [marine sediment metagenome]|uniref:Uncharacterized protein n=1 Tax=marine sediment metagenome TaxID=412755 RepID=A0A0F9J5Z7_9ZZZZ